MLKKRDLLNVPCALAEKQAVYTDRAAQPRQTTGDEQTQSCAVTKQGRSLNPQNLRALWIEALALSHPEDGLQLRCWERV